MPALFLQDIVVHAVIAVSLFAGAVAMAAYIPDWRDAITALEGSSNPFFENLVQALRKTLTTSEAVAVSKPPSS